jgi:hypothetical protein
MAAAHILGSTHLNISLYDFMGNWPSDEPERAEFLRDLRPLCDWLADEFPLSLRTIGVGVPFSEDMARAVHLEEAEAGDWNNLKIHHRGWAGWLGGAGLSFALRPQPGVQALGGAGVWAFSDEQLRSWLAGGVVLDGQATAILLERGFGPLIGIDTGRYVTQDDFPYSFEHCLDPAFGLREGAEITLNWPRYAEKLFLPHPAEEARVVSDVRGPRQEVLGPALTLFENDRGGRVASFPWLSERDMHMFIQRALQLRKLVAWLDPTRTYGSVEGGPWLIPQFLADADTQRGVIWNQSPDALTEFTVHPPAGFDFSSAQHVSAGGKFLPATWAGGRVELSQPLHQWEFVVLS